VAKSLNKYNMLAMARRVQRICFVLRAGLAAYSLLKAGITRCIALLKAKTMFAFKKKTVRSEFELMLDPCVDGLFSSALRLTRNRAQAEDLVQETVMRGWKFFEQYERGTNFKAWMFRILSNTFINTYRKNSREKTLENESERQSVEALSCADEIESPEEALLTHLTKQEIHAAIDRLPIDFRMAIVLADLQELSYKEVSEILNVPVGTVMSRLFRGRKMLHKYLSQAPSAATIDLNEWKLKRSSA
jgi:RNA polymerase sigma-70 factor, ECF subfamily